MEIGPGVVTACPANDSGTLTEKLRAVQTFWLVRRRHLEPNRARLLADIVFQVGGRDVGI